MTGRRGPTPPSGRWERLVPADEVFNRKTGVTTKLPVGTTAWVNNRYVVLKSPHVFGFPTETGWSALVMDGIDVVGWHLSIRRQDRGPIRDWRHMQRIKNELCGEDAEGVELYPAESRLVDEANQFHLYILPVGARWPCGVWERQVGGAAEAAELGAVQRDFEEA